VKAVFDTNIVATTASTWASRRHYLGRSKASTQPPCHSRQQEFLNRLDDMIVFQQLERNDLVKIVDLEVAKVIERVRVKDITVRLDTTALEFLID